MVTNMAEQQTIIRRYTSSSFDESAASTQGKANIIYAFIKIWKFTF